MKKLKYYFFKPISDNIIKIIYLIFIFINFINFYFNIYDCYFVFLLKKDNIYIYIE